MDVNKQYPLENHQTILQVFLSFFSFFFHMVVTSQLAVEAEATEFVSELLRHPRTDPNLPDQVTNGFCSFTDMVTTVFSSFLITHKWFSQSQISTLCSVGEAEVPSALCK